MIHKIPTKKRFLTEIKGQKTDRILKVNLNVFEAVTFLILAFSI
jgi:hypothetical protein